MTTTMTLSTDQEHALELLRSHRNVFLTGVAGTGKTFVLNEWLREQFLGVAVTASTGIAATHLGGTTLHSWCGMGIKGLSADRIAARREWAYGAGKRMQRANTLIIDEVSMLDAETLDTVEELCRRAHFDPSPWGGMQVVLVGDLGQLPPVQADSKGFVWDAHAWSNSAIQAAELTHVHRQEDREFVKVLNEVRAGRLSDESYSILASRIGAFDPEKEGATRIMTHNKQVDAVNEQKLRSLPGPLFTYTASDSGMAPHVRALDRSCLSPKVLNLRVGATVMTTRNDLDHRWVNGSLGRVQRLTDNSVHVRFMSGDVWEVAPAKWEVTDDRGHVLAERVQHPLRLAWAATAHKMQGSTLDKASMDLSRAFAPGQAYVALSRVRTLDGINIEAWGGRRSIMCDARVRKVLRDPHFGLKSK